MAYKYGVTKHLLNGMILQVVGGLLNRPNLDKIFACQMGLDDFALIVLGKDKKHHWNHHRFGMFGDFHPLFGSKGFASSSNWKHHPPVAYDCLTWIKDIFVGGRESPHFSSPIWDDQPAGCGPTLIC